MIFVIVITVLVRHTTKKLGRSQDQSNKKLTIRLLISLIGVMTLFGLSWLFGALTVREASVAFQFLFAIFNSFQGFFIFLFFCVLGSEARELWIQLICRGRKIPGISGPSTAGKVTSRGPYGTGTGISTVSTAVSSTSTGGRSAGTAFKASVVSESVASEDIIEVNVEVAQELGIIVESQEKPDVHPNEERESSLSSNSPAGAEAGLGSGSLPPASETGSRGSSHRGSPGLEAQGEGETLSRGSSWPASSLMDGASPGTGPGSNDGSDDNSSDSEVVYNPHVEDEPQTDD